MNIELNISVKQSDIPPTHLQRIRRCISVMQNISDVTMTFKDEDDEDARERTEHYPIFEATQQALLGQRTVLSKNKMAFPAKYR